MPGVGGGAGGGFGVEAISSESTGQRYEQETDLRSKRPNGDTERSKDALKSLVVGLPESVQVIRQPAVHFMDVVSEFIELFVEAGTDKREHKILLWHQDVEAGCH